MRSINKNVCLYQTDARGAGDDGGEEGLAVQRDLPAERRHGPAARVRDAAPLHQPLPARHRLTGQEPHLLTPHGGPGVPGNAALWGVAADDCVLLKTNHAQHISVIIITT